MTPTSDKPMSPFKPFAPSVSIPLLLTVTLGWPDVIASSNADRQRHLDALREQIVVEARKLDDTRADRNVLEDQLRKAEVDANAVVRRLRQLKEAMSRTAYKLQELRSDRRERQAKTQRLRAQLAREARVGYAFGRGDYIRIALNQQDPSKVSRALSYHLHVSRARARRIEKTVDEIRRIESVETDIQAEQNELKKLRERTEVARHEHELQRKRRQEVLRALERDIVASELRLDGLKGNAARLERLIARIGTLPPMPLVLPPKIAGGDRATNPRTRQVEPGQPLEALVGYVPFAKRRGKLSWPTHGHLIDDDSSSDEHNPGYRGVVIQAPAGQPVRAIAPGQVVYADWLRGMGLLLIVEHEDGYLSLYGHARELLMGPGDWVDVGDVVGTVGDSGGRKRPELYFGIRRGTKAQKPGRWCRGLPNQVSAKSSG